MNVIENRLFQIARRVGEFICFQCDAEGVLLPGEINESAREVIGTAALKDTCWIHEKDRSLYAEKWRLLLGGKSSSETFSCETLIKTGKWQVVEITVEKLDASDPASGYVGLIKDLTAQMQKEKEFANATQLFEAIFENYPCPVFVKDIDNDLRYIMSNAAHGQLCRSFTNGRVQAIGSQDSDIFPEDMATLIHENDRTAIESEDHSFDGIERAVTADGLLFATHSVKRVIELADGRRLLIGVSMDVTSQEKAEHELARTSRLLQTIMDNLTCSLFVKDADDDFKYVMANRFFTNFVGLKEEEIIGKTDAEIFPNTTDVEKCRKTDQLAVENGFADTREVIVTSSGSTYSLRTVETLTDDENGRRLLIGVCLDMTAQEAAENELARTSRLLQTMMDNMPCPLFVKDPDDDFRYIMGNHAFAKLAGVSQEDVPGKTDFDFFPEAEGCYQTDQFAASDGVIDCKEVITGGDGKIHHVRTVESITTDFIDGRRLLLGVAIDITEQEMMERELARTSRLLQTIMDNLTCSLFVKDPDDDFRYVMINKFYANFIGLPAEEVIGKNDYEVFPDQSDADQCQRTDLLALENGFADCKETVVSNDGKTYVLRNVETITDYDDGRRLLIGICVDMTAQEEAENELARTSRLLQTMMDNMPCPLFVKDPDNGFRYIMGNHAFAKMAGISPEDVPGKTDFDFFPEAAGCYQTDQHAASDGVIDCKEIITFGDGTVHHVRTVESITPDFIDGRRLLLGVAIDITEQETMERELARTSRLLQTIMDNLTCSLFVKDVNDDFRYVMVNKFYADFIGLPVEEILGKSDLEIFANQDDVEQCLRTDRLALENGCADCKEKIISNGKTYFLRNVETITDYDDGRRLLIGVCLDMTAQEEAENELARTSRLLQTMMDNMPCPLFVKDPDNGFRYIMGNHAFAKMAGISPEDVPGKTDFDFFPEAAGCYQTDQHAASDGVIDCKEIITFGDGTVHHVRTVESITPDFIDGRRLLLGVAIDITEQEMMERELARTSRLLQTIMDNLTCSLFVKDVDDDFRYVMANKFYAAFVGMPPEEIVGKTDTDLFVHKENAEQCRRVDMMAVEAGFADSKETLVSNEGETFVLRCVKSIIVHDDGRRLLIGVCVDMTAQEEAENRLIAALSAAESANKAKSFFLATVSHELRTPLNAVIGFSEILKQGGISTVEQMDCVDTINLAGNALLNLINDVLDLSKIEADQMGISLQRFDISSILDEIMAIFSYKAKEKGIGFSLVCSQKLPMMEIDSLRLRQILLNVVGNALKFTREGCVKVEVDFLPEPGSSCLADMVIRVIDTGTGIPPEEQKRIFEPFVQQRSHSSTAEGTGLGLTITSRLVEKMGGSISLESEVGKGSTFTIRLRGIHYIEDETYPRAPVSELAEPLPVVSDDIDILIVDDVPVNLKVLAAMLKQFNLSCRMAGSGEAALNAIEEKVPDLVLTDMWMPGIDGQELAARIRQMPQCKNVKIVSVTADSESRANFDMSLFDDIFLKPLTLEKLSKLFVILGRKEK